MEKNCLVEESLTLSLEIAFIKNREVKKIAFIKYTYPEPPWFFQYPIFLKIYKILFFLNIQSKI